MVIKGVESSGENSLIIFIEIPVKLLFFAG